jgi:hypothetical protein
VETVKRHCGDRVKPALRAGNLSREVHVKVLAAFMATAMVVGCSDGGDDPTAPFTTDIRIDGAPDSADPDSIDSKMCVNTLGHTYVVWLDSRGDNNGKNSLYMNRSLTRPWDQTVEAGIGDNWLAAPVKVNHGEGNVWAPDLYCNELGTFVTWEDDRDGILGSHQIYFNRTTDGGETFMEEDILLEPGDEDGNSMSLGPRIAGSGQDIYVTWYDGLNGAYDILVASSGDTGITWRDPTRIDSDNAGESYSGVPKIAVSDNASDVWAVWEDSRNGVPPVQHSDIYFAHSSVGGISFDEDERIDTGDEPGEADSFSPQICASDEFVYVVWHDARNGEGRDIYMNYSNDSGGDWGVAAQRLDGDTAGLGNSVDPVCVADGSTLHVAWQDNHEDNSGYDILYREVRDGLPAGAPIRLDAGDPPGSANSLQPRIALAHDTGNVVVMWRDGRGEAQGAGSSGYDDLYYNYMTPDQAFANEADYRVDSYYDGSSFKLDTSLAALGGRMYAAWSDGRDGTADIYFTSYPVGEEAIPPLLSDAQ